MNWKDRRVLITGGASFIGSHLLDSLLAKNPSAVRVVDDLSSGVLENISGHVESGAVEFVQRDLLEPGVAEHAVDSMDVVFHLAAIHGGRGFIDLNQAACAQNLALDGMLIRAAHRADVDKLIFASSGCVYPVELQQDTRREVFLTEDMVGPPYSADGMYGWAKLMTELTLKAYYDDYGFKSASCRFFTAYGERCLENHAIVAMIARAFIRQDPFEVWGDGNQVRNWTHVSDIVSGMILAAEKIDDGTAVNLGTEERTRVIDAVKEVVKLAGYDPEIKLLRDMPTGPLNRVASPQLARKLLGWDYEINFQEGLRRTMDWYFADKSREQVEGSLGQLLTGRSTSAR